ncbi:hypothetical protein PSHT_03099 [Puccinia striiformis]|uniref:Uncharacterized protein n=1 Tax=Puccinia striiformis TaxID=27350 RepID=A0A2S4WGD5_9BASI|nr:hypothetical protein PSHT_03099 [Puccinia striiformis]
MHILPRGPTVLRAKKLNSPLLIHVVLTSVIKRPWIDNHDQAALQRRITDDTSENSELAQDSALAILKPKGTKKSIDCPLVSPEKIKDNPPCRGARSPLESVCSSPSKRRYRRTQGASQQRPRQPESATKADQKAEVKEFTKGWNPWEIKKQLFPNDNNGKGKAKNNGGKARSSASKSMMKYNDQEGWDDVFDLTYTLRGAFNSAKMRRLN